MNQKNFKCNINIYKTTKDHNTYYMRKLKCKHNPDIEKHPFTQFDFSKLNLKNILLENWNPKINTLRTISVYVDMSYLDCKGTLQS